MMYCILDIMHRYTCYQFMWVPIYAYQVPNSLFFPTSYKLQYVASKCPASSHGVFIKSVYFILVLVADVTDKLGRD